MNYDLTFIAGLLLCISLIAIAVQGTFLAAFCRSVRRPLSQGFSDGGWPHVTVLVSLRGADPRLETSLTRLMQLDYPHYDLKLVVDSCGDPAWKSVQAAREATGFRRLHVEALNSPPAHCGLKNAALVQMTRNFHEHCQVVVLVDADVVAHSTWLKELVAPLSDEKVGACGGNRWFRPHTSSCGSIVRYLWNAAAVVPMYVCGMPWGGSLAIRRSLLEKGALREQWSRAIVDDTPVKAALDSFRMRFVFVPQLMIFNHEACNLHFARDFIRRQLTWTRIYHAGWSAVVTHAVISTGIMFSVPFLAVVAFSQGNSKAAILLAGAISLYLLAMIAMTRVLEQTMAAIAARRGESLSELGTATWLSLIVFIPLTQAIHAGASIAATFGRQITWRGIVYRIRGPWDIERLNYEPASKDAPSGHSI